MGEEGDKVDLLVLCLPDGSRYALPLSPMATLTDYTLLRVEPAPEETGLSDLLCISFARGTLITLANGAQTPIETLTPGDRILTRDHGGQPVRWIGRATLKAVGPFAPVVITMGTLGNAGDLIVSQHHRMFLYQRQKVAGLPTAELLVQAKHLVDGERVFLREGGYVDYLSLVFDRHEIIYAEGVPAESLMVNDATVNRLPAELSADVKSRFPGLSQVQHFGTEAGRRFLEAVGPETLFKPGPRRR
ncbi:MAG: Hint domain-containing protein [Brevundimonas sp.]|uniref:Hint domain-containing protein n=1 Tax=Brevundimonas sp. TaxID=1871086 RepID=UPI0027364A53|nr:Hint domain-containing protein [Brevundimonas sp.]MDP3378026.1 Hint domain-containing protein [Brevundimonas sp.]